MALPVVGVFTAPRGAVGAVKTPTRSSMS